jgi:hypothetical protein
MIRLTAEGHQHVPRVPHHFPAWGGIKELLRVNGGSATRAAVLEVLGYCGHHKQQFQPNTAYLDYAIKNGWLAES